MVDVQNDQFILSNGMELNTYLACSIAEGFYGGEEYQNNPADTMLAWSYIGTLGLHKTLQGWYGRNLFHMVDNGVLNDDFSINQERLDEILDKIE